MPQTQVPNKYPILYSFRRCPYAIRARLAIAVAGLSCELREVALKDKPSSMLKLSPKGTVPILQTIDDKVIDESLDVMYWALEKNDPNGWLNEAIDIHQREQLIQSNDGEFKDALDRYKYFERYPEKSQDEYLAQALPFLEELEAILNKTDYLSGQRIGITDAAIMPFIRQFCMVDRPGFESLPFTQLQTWLSKQLESDLFLNTMTKYDKWQTGNKPVLFT